MEALQPIEKKKKEVFFNTSTLSVAYFSAGASQFLNLREDKYVTFYKGSTDSIYIGYADVDDPRKIRVKYNSYNGTYSININSYNTTFQPKEKYEIITLPIPYKDGLVYELRKIK